MPNQQKNNVQLYWKNCILSVTTFNLIKGWEYSTALFIGFNFLGFLIIGIGYSIINQYIIPRLIQKGITIEQIHILLHKNPKKLLKWWKGFLLFCFFQGQLYF